jgi:F0F1-type ATP synthase assembly protein I
MLKALSTRTLVIAWVALLIAVAGTAAVSGVSITAGISALWLAACVVPPAVMLMVWRGAPPPTTAEILHAVDRRD